MLVTIHKSSGVIEASVCFSISPITMENVHHFVGSILKFHDYGAARTALFCATTTTTIYAGYVGEHDIIGITLRSCCPDAYDITS